MYSVLDPLLVTDSPNGQLGAGLIAAGSWLGRNLDAMSTEVRNIDDMVPR